MSPGLPQLGHLEKKVFPKCYKNGPNLTSTIKASGDFALSLKEPCDFPPEIRESERTEIASNKN